MRTRNLITAGALALALLTNGISAAAQQQTTEKRRGVSPTVVEKREVEVIVQGPEGSTAPLPPPPGDAFGIGVGGGDNTFVFVSTEMSLNGKTVKGAPYSAQAVTEMVQTLADGNRIVRRNTANVYRDSEGRTRRDQTLGTIGPYAAAGDPPQTFFINDPVAGINYILDPRTKTARKMVLQFRVANRPDVVGEAKVQTAPAPSPDAKPRVSQFTFSTPAAPPAEGAEQAFYFDREHGNEPKTESLGKQIVEGVEAEGVRVTLTFPAGSIGNEQPLNIVSERWYSKDLQLVVLTRHSDPRSGETTYRLTNLNRSEPAHSLFEVPGDYTIKEMPSFQRMLRVPRSPAPPAPAPDNL